MLLRNRGFETDSLFEFFLFVGVAVPVKDTDYNGDDGPEYQRKDTFHEPRQYHTLVLENGFEYLVIRIVATAIYGEFDMLERMRKVLVDDLLVCARHDFGRVLESAAPERAQNDDVVHMESRTREDLESTGLVEFLELLVRNLDTLPVLVVIRVRRSFSQVRGRARDYVDVLVREEVIVVIGLDDFDFRRIDNIVVVQSRPVRTMGRVEDVLYPVYTETRVKRRTQQIEQKYLLVFDFFTVILQTLVIPYFEKS